MLNLKNKRVFVSGAAGVIGREILPILIENGANVIAGDIELIPKEFLKNVTFIRRDLNYITQEELNFYNPEIFIHLAASFERSIETYGHWEENFWHNLRLSNHLMTLMRNVKGLKRVVFASSYLIYEKSLYTYKSAANKPSRLKESDPISPRNLTGMAKLVHEIELEFLNNFKNDKFTSVCARIFRGYGKNSRDIISRWVRDLISNKKIQVYKPEGIFDYTHATDTAKGLLKLALSEYKGVINLGTGRSRRVKDIIEILKKYFTDLKMEEIISEGSYEASEADTKILKKVINWVPEINLETAIPDIIEFEKSQDNTKKKSYFPNVLITSISKKVPLIKAVKNGVKKVSDKPKIFGADVDGSCIGRYFVDVFWQMPRFDDLDIQDLLSFCNVNEIKAIIPTRDAELEFFAKYKSILSENGITVMVSEHQMVMLCLDKLKFAECEHIRNIAIPTSKTISNLSSEKFVVKERYGAGSKSIGLNLNYSAALSHARTLKNPIFQPFKKGFEISVDAYITRNKKIKGLILRKRDKVVNGESQITTIFENISIKKRFIDFLSKFDLYGHLNLQAIIDEKDNLHLIECNSRIGGASMLSIHAGLDTFFWFYLEVLGVNINEYLFIPATKPIKQIRYYNDIYI